VAATKAFEKESGRFKFREDQTHAACQAFIKMAKTIGGSAIGTKHPDNRTLNGAPSSRSCWPALVTYGGVSLFVAFFVLAPMAQALFRAASIPRRLMPAAIALGTSTFTMSALPGTPAIQNAIPMPFFGTTPFAAPGLGVIASAIMLGFGLWWLGRARGVRQARPAARLRPPGTAGRSVQAGRRPPPSLDGAGGPMPLRRPPKHPDRNMRSGSVISQVMPSASQSIRALPLHPWRFAR
jgi:hypothetical protein